MEIVSDGGRTSIVYRLKEGLVLKLPRSSVPEGFRAEIASAFVIEKQLLERLGPGPRIVRYRGVFRAGEDMEEGFLFDEANCGDLQSYMDGEREISDTLRMDWSVQIAEALAYVHERGIIHSNLSTTNVLVHQTGQTTNLLLADFGGSRCRDLDLDGGMLPDPPFFDSKSDFKTKRLDVFSLGILLYIINTGQYPFHTGPAPQDEERFQYGCRVQKLFDDGKFPDLLGVQFGGVILGCCVKRQYATAGEVVEALKAEMQ